MEDYYDTHEQDDLKDWEDEQAFQDAAAERRQYALDYPACEHGIRDEYCPQCDEKDDDPQCVCGFYASEHHPSMGACARFQTGAEWDEEKNWIAKMSDDEYERIFPDGGDY